MCERNSTQTIVSFTSVLEARTTTFVSTKTISHKNF